MPRWLLPTLIALMLAVGCVRQSASQVINLSHLEPLPASRSTDIMPLRVAIAAVISPQGTAESYSVLLDYLSNKLDRRQQTRAAF